MNLLKKIGVRWENFFFDYFEKDTIPPYYCTASPEVGPGPDSNEKNRAIVAFGNIAIVNSIPPYLEHHTRSLIKGLGSIDRSYRQGYLLDFEGYSDPDAFLRSSLGSNAFRKIRRDSTRLFQIEGIDFKEYFGSMDSHTFQTHMGQLRAMIEKRFATSPECHLALQRWSEYMDTAHNMIKAKKASMFVVYNHENPIAISLNYHREGALFVSLNSYDSDYLRYGPGKLLVVKAVQWCFQNGFTKLDLGWGNYPFKKKMANNVYKYKTQVIYRKGIPLLNIAAYLISYTLERKYQSTLEHES